MYDTIPHYALKFLRRKVYPIFFKPHQLPPLECEEDLDRANQMIYDLLASNKPCMIGRFGGFEMYTAINYMFISGHYPHSVWKYIQGEGWEWWWNNKTLSQMSDNAGFWPASHENAEKYSKLLIEDSKFIDITASLYRGEWYFREELKNCKKISFFTLEPFFSNNPWTKALKGKKVLVVHPFANSIERQYRLNREKLFNNKDLLPQFDLTTYMPVQSLGGNPNYKDWFDALEQMERDIDKIDYDIAILGCGAYGYELAAHIKRQGKKAVHLGGVTQMLFGIRGVRWDNPVPNMCKYGYYPDLMNESWVRPGEEEKPKIANKVEGGCYW